LLFLAGSVVPGAGAFEIAAHAALVKFKDTVKGRARLGKIVTVISSIDELFHPSQRKCTITRFRKLSYNSICKTC